jgi:hypothetical protein
MMKPGFYTDMTEEDYHTQKLLDEPALSYSIAKLLVTQTPMHAKHAHPLLGSKDAGSTTPAQSKGTLAHSLILGKGKGIEVLQFDSFRTNDAKAARDKAEAEGKLPVLQSAVDECSQLVTTFITQMKDTEYASSFFDPECQSELCMYWRDPETGILMQGMLDRLNLKTPIIFDLKLTTDASTKTVEKKIFDMGYHIQNAFYRRGVGTIIPELIGAVRFVFLFIEVDPPYALNIIEFSGMYEYLADLEADRSISIWSECMKSGKWPGYLSGGKANDAFPPTWVIKEKQLG